MPPSVNKFITFEDCATLDMTCGKNNGNIYKCKRDCLEYIEQN